MKLFTVQIPRHVYQFVGMSARVKVRYVMDIIYPVGNITDHQELITITATQDVSVSVI